VDLLVNNAGTLVEAGPLMDVDLGRFRATVEINLMGTLGFTQEVWRAGMRERGGAVVNVSSLSGLRVFPGQAAYTVTKAAVLQLTRQLALDMAPGVRVNAVAPGVTRTDAGREHWEGREALLATEFPLRRIGEPADVAAAVTYLLSDDAAWVTGETLLLDGGWSLLSQSSSAERGS
jgi:3-oxoacyl-[acyl-carrier protein] reductase